MSATYNFRCLRPQHTNVYDDHVLASDYAALEQENKTLHEQVAFLQSREVCTLPHEDVETCGYCQRERLRDALLKARDTFRDFERVNRVLGRSDMATAAGIAREALDEALSSRETCE